jgi:hypothetical protein
MQAAMAKALRAKEVKIEQPAQPPKQGGAPKGIKAPQRSQPMQGSDLRSTIKKAMGD